MTCQSKRAPSPDRNCLEDAVARQQAVVEDRHDGIGWLEELAVHVNRSHCAAV